MINQATMGQMHTGFPFNFGGKRLDYVLACGIDIELGHDFWNDESFQCKDNGKRIDD